jgi:hypothetical protein
MTSEIEKAKTLQGANEIKILDDLILCEIDWQSNELVSTISNLAIVTNLKICQMYKSLNVLFSKFDDEFIKFYDALGNELVLYSDYNSILQRHNGNICVKRNKKLLQRFSNTNQCK